MRRVPSSRATIAAGTSPPRVMHTIASKGPAPASRQASARASRWNWSQETGKAFCVGAFMAARASGGHAVGAQAREEGLDAPHRVGDALGVLAAHYDRVLEPRCRERRIGAD